MTTFAANAHQRGIAVLEDPIIDKTLPSKHSSSRRYTPTKHPTITATTFNHNPWLPVKRSTVARIACADEEPEGFFGPVDSSEDAELLAWEKRALALCATCLMQEKCLAEALRHPAAHQHGVVGGMTASQRRALLRHRCRKGAQAV